MNRDLPKLTTGEYKITERNLNSKKKQRTAKYSPDSSISKKIGDHPTQLIVDINPTAVVAN